MLLLLFSLLRVIIVLIVAVIVLVRHTYTLMVIGIMVPHKLYLNSSYEKKGGNVVESRVITVGWGEGEGGVGDYMCLFSVKRSLGSRPLLVKSGGSERLWKGVASTPTT